MNRVASDLSWYQKLKRRVTLRHNVWHEYQDGLCCEVEFKDGDLRYRHGDWCDCSTATQRREFASRRRVDAEGHDSLPPPCSPGHMHGDETGETIVEDKGRPIGDKGPKLSRSLHQVSLVEHDKQR